MAEFKGTLRKKMFAEGSKFAHLAFVLDTGERELLVRRTGASPFELDNRLEPMEGQTVVCRGTLEPPPGSYILNAETCEPAKE